MAFIAKFVFCVDSIGDTNNLLKRKMRTNKVRFDSFCINRVLSQIGYSTCMYRYSCQNIYIIVGIFMDWLLNNRTLLWQIRFFLLVSLLSCHFWRSNTHQYDKSTNNTLQLLWLYVRVFFFFAILLFCMSAHKQCHIWINREKVKVKAKSHLILFSETITRVKTHKFQLSINITMTPRLKALPWNTCSFDEYNAIWKTECIKSGHFSLHYSK